MAKSLISIDLDRAEVASRRTVLAYELADILSDFAEEAPELRADALNVGMVVIAFNLLDMGLNEKQAVAQFASTFRATRRANRQAGDKPRLRDTLTEMHLDHRKDRRKRA